MQLVVRFENNASNSYALPMQILSFADHVSSPAALAAFIILIVLELLSLAIFWLIVRQYRHVVSKHRMLPLSLQRSLEQVPDTGPTLLFWSYVVLTIIWTVFTTLLFIFQPHLF